MQLKILQVKRQNWLGTFNIKWQINQKADKETDKNCSVNILWQLMDDRSVFTMPANCTAEWKNESNIRIWTFITQDSWQTWKLSMVFVVNWQCKDEDKNEKRAKKVNKRNEFIYGSHFHGSRAILFNAYIFCLYRFVFGRSVFVLCAPFIVPLKNVTYACNHNQFVINMVIFNK